MGEIVKRHGFWQRRGWVLLAFVNLVLQTIIHKNPYWLAILVVTCSAFVYFVFFRKSIKEDYISWDESTIRIREGGQEYKYNLEVIEEIDFRNNHLRIKSGAANGLLLNLKGYASEDVELLKSSLGFRQDVVSEASI